MHEMHLGFHLQHGMFYKLNIKEKVLVNALTHEASYAVFQVVAMV